MMSQNETKGAWVTSAVKALGAKNSWTGRIHIHKLLFTTQILKVAQPPYEFELYNYGPYSFELDERIAELELLGFLDRSYPRPGYGPRYRVAENPPALADNLQKAVDRVAGVLGDRDSKALEILATCLWVEEKEDEHTTEKIVARVRKLKPQYDDSEIAAGCEDARNVRLTLAAG